jgi:hypothetical protein
MRPVFNLTMIADLENKNKIALFFILLRIDTYKILGLFHQRTSKIINCRKAEINLVFIWAVIILLSHLKRHD